MDSAEVRVRIRIGIALGLILNPNPNTPTAFILHITFRIPHITDARKGLQRQMKLTRDHRGPLKRPF